MMSRGWHRQPACRRYVTRIRAVKRYSPPCGFWIKSRMTAWDARQSGIPVLRILDQVWNDWPGWRGFAGLGRCGTSFSPCSQCQALGQALVLCYQGRGGFCRLVWTCSPESPCHPVNSPLREHDGRFCKGVHQGRGGWWLAWTCSPASPCRPVDSRLRGNDGYSPV